MDEHEEWHADRRAEQEPGDPGQGAGEELPGGDTVEPVGCAVAGIAQQAADDATDDVRDQRPDDQPDDLPGGGVGRMADLVAGKGADQYQDQAEDLNEEHAVTTLVPPPTKTG